MLFAAALWMPQDTQAADITPFFTFNQSPLVQIFGLPALENAVVVPPGRLAATLATDLASNFGVDRNGKDDIVLDGETYRSTLALRYGVTRGWEIGIDIPWITEGGGFLDGFVSGFHDGFGLSPAGRDEAPRNRLLYSYSRFGTQRFLIDHPNNGLGDIRLGMAFQLYRDEESPASAISLRAAVKLPTGNSGTLHGSGATDFAVWLSGADAYEVGSGSFAVFAGAGGMFVGKGDVLADMQRDLAAFGTIGVGWSPLSWFALKTQFLAHSPFFRNSSLHELGVTALVWTGGVTFDLPWATSLDIGISEDLAIVAASPDVVFHVALRTVF